MFETGYVQPEVDYNTSESRLTHMGEVARKYIGPNAHFIEIKISLE